MMTSVMNNWFRLIVFSFFTCLAYGPNEIRAKSIVFVSIKLYNRLFGKIFRCPSNPWDGSEIPTPGPFPGLICILSIVDSVEWVTFPSVWGQWTMIWVNCPDSSDYRFRYVEGGPVESGPQPAVSNPTFPWTHNLSQSLWCHFLSFLKIYFIQI